MSHEGERATGGRIQCKPDRAPPHWLNPLVWHRRVFTYYSAATIEKTTQTQRRTDKPAQTRLGHPPINMPRTAEYAPRTNKQRPTTTRPASEPKPTVRDRTAKAATQPRAAYPNHLSLWKACVMPNAPAQAGRANDLRLSTCAETRPCLQPVCSPTLSAMQSSRRSPPRTAGTVALREPTEGQIRQLTNSRVMLNHLPQRHNHRVTCGNLLRTRMELPSAILAVVRNMQDRLAKPKDL